MHTLRPPSTTTWPLHERSRLIDWFSRRIFAEPAQYFGAMIRSAVLLSTSLASEDGGEIDNLSINLPHYFNCVLQRIRPIQDMS